MFTLHLLFNTGGARSRVKFASQINCYAQCLHVAKLSLWFDSLCFSKVKSTLAARNALFLLCGSYLKFTLCLRISLAHSFRVWVFSYFPRV